MPGLMTRPIGSQPLNTQQGLPSPAATRAQWYATLFGWAVLCVSCCLPEPSGSACAALAGSLIPDRQVLILDLGGVQGANA